MREIPGIKRFTVITGHYGCGKTNLAINLAFDLAAAGEQVTLVDLDIVNPYFRSSDYTELLESHGIRVIGPTAAGTTLDTPWLSPAVQSVFGSEGVVLFDVGGDDAGATALGRYARDISALDHDLLYVVNRYRTLTSTPAEAAALLREIEAASHLRATGVVNNSHLRRETTVDTVLNSVAFAKETAELLGLPLVCTTVPTELAERFSDETCEAAFVRNAYPVKIHVKTPWEDSPGV